MPPRSLLILDWLDAQLVNYYDAYGIVFSYSVLYHVDCIEFIWNLE